MKSLKIQAILIFTFIYLLSFGNLLAADLEWYNSESDAFSEAAAQGKKIILFAGSDLCIHCLSMKYVVFQTEDPPIKELLENNFILWYSNVATSTEHYKYLSDYPYNEYGIPLILVIDPESENLYEDRTMGAQSSSEFYSRLLGHLPEPDITVWKLISLSKEPDVHLTSSVLSSIMDKVISVWAYKDKKWLVYDPENPDFSDLEEMESGTGYWLHLTEDISIDSDLSFSGTAVEKTLSLCAGWNLIGYSSSTEKSLPDILSPIEGKYISVWAYKNKKWLIYDPENPDFNDLTQMEPGCGYWINASSNCELPKIRD